MLIESTEYFFSFSSEWEFEDLSFQLFLYLESLFESYSRLILCTFLVDFDFFETIRSYLSGNSLWYERVTSLRCGYIDNSSFPTKMSNILEEFYSNLECWHSLDYRKYIPEEYMEDSEKWKFYSLNTKPKNFVNYSAFSFYPVFPEYLRIDFIGLLLS
jgi:hypothetical protein